MVTAGPAAGLKTTWHVPTLSTNPTPLARQQRACHPSLLQGEHSNGSFNIAFLHRRTSPRSSPLRLKIIKKAQSPDVMLGRQTLLNCAYFEGYGSGCDGGDTVDVFGYMQE